MCYASQTLRSWRPALDLGSLSLHSILISATIAACAFPWTFPGLYRALSGCWPHAACQQLPRQLPQHLADFMCLSHLSFPALPALPTLRRSAEWVVIKFLASGEADSLDNIDAEFIGLMGFTGPYCGSYGELTM